MCGIVGYIGTKNVKDILLNGLQKLEYRGYDSAGVALMNGKKLNVCKKKGRLFNLKNAIEEENIKGSLGIGHTRWATHGEPNEINSHPHVNSKGDIAVVHNGIIENYEVLKASLIKKGYVFVSETDTEVIPHLIDYFYEDSLLEAVKRAVSALEGSFALGVISASEPDKIIAVKRDSQLIVAFDETGNYIASDIPAILDETKNYYLLEDDEFVVLKNDSVSFFDKNGVVINKKANVVDFSAEAAQKGGYEHYMIKEIHEQPKAILDTLRGRISKDLKINLEIDAKEFKKFERIYIVACGTAYHAGIAGKRMIERVAHIPTEVVLASEFRYGQPLLNDKTLIIVISQSGETADTISSLRLSKEQGCSVLAIVNVLGSSIAREADYVLYTYAGPEIAVASTKAYTTQLIVLYLFALLLAEMKNVVSKQEIESLKKEIFQMPKYVEEVLKCENHIKAIAQKIFKEDDIYYLGRGADFAAAMEGSLKLKEVSYIHSETYAGGELKHGPIALIENGTVVIAINTDKSICRKMDSNIKEVLARGAYTIGIVSKSCMDESNAFDDIIVLSDISPLLSPVLSVVSMQLLAYYTSVKKGCDVDKPRNLAKSVTVE